MDGFARELFDLGATQRQQDEVRRQPLVAIHNVAAAEAMVLAMKVGLDPRQTVEVVASGAGTSRVFELRAPMMAAGPYLPATMRSATWQKDLDVIGAFAADVGCPTPLLRRRCWPWGMGRRTPRRCVRCWRGWRG